MFIDYPTWRHQQEEFTQDEALVPCPSCFGVGVSECDCCGNEVSCSRCDEEGRIPFGEVADHEYAFLFSRSRYEDALINDAVALGEWIGSDPIELLYNNGLEPWQDLIIKKIHINP